MSTVPVTDHAVIRYLERCKGVDIEAIRQRIAESQKKLASVGVGGVG